MILLFFVKYSVLSAYRCHTLLMEEYEKRGRKISYKNVREKVKKLELEGLITAINDGQSSKHGAINMTITSLGIFYINKSKLYLPSLNIIVDHKKDGLYDSFLYPFIQYKTLINIIDSHILKIVFDYLNQCCNLLEQEFEHFQSIQEKGVTNLSIASTDSITDPELHDLETVGLKGFPDHLTSRFNLQWLKNDKIITKIKRVTSNEIVITKGRKKIVITLLPKESKALVSYLNSCLGELPIEGMPNDNTHSEYIFMEYKPITVEELWHSKNFYIHSKLKRLSFDLANYILEYNCTDFYNTKKELKTKKESLKLLQLDSRFMDLMIEMTARINFCYDNFINIK